MEESDMARKNTTGNYKRDAGRAYMLALRFLFARFIYRCGIKNSNWQGRSTTDIQVGADKECRRAFLDGQEVRRRGTDREVLQRHIERIKRANQRLDEENQETDVGVHTFHTLNDLVEYLRGESYKNANNETVH